MKGFERKNLLFSLCGLNCGLCPMRIGGYCPGCGGGAGNQSCKIAKCGIECGNTDYCFRCESYPCAKYAHIDDFDSFITHRNRKADLEKARRIGIENYNEAQREKVEILRFLLSNYNDGRKKTLFCTAVNLMDLNDLRELRAQLENCPESTGAALKEKSAFVAKQIMEISNRKGLDLSLRKKKDK